MLCVSALVFIVTKWTNGRIPHRVARLSKDTQRFQNNKRTPQGWHALTEASQHCRAQNHVSQQSLVSLHTVCLC